MDRPLPRRLPLLLLAALCDAGVRPAASATATPDHYDLAFVVDSPGKRFEGTETIRVGIDQPTDRIVLNAAELESGGHISCAAPRQRATVSLDRWRRNGDLDRRATAAGRARGHPDSVHRRAERQAPRLLHRPRARSGTTPSPSSNRPTRGARFRASTSRRTRRRSLSR